jgi:PAS domain-containing protein
MKGINTSELEQAQARCELALYAGNLGLWGWHVPSGKVVFNQRWCEMLGWTIDEIKQNVSSWSDRVHPNDWGIIPVTLI